MMSKKTETSEEVESQRKFDSRGHTGTASPLDDPRFCVGEVLLDKYRVECVLGQGGMGLVLGARHVELGELFAIKLMRGDAIQHPSIVERFMREARAMARLRSAHVARVHDVGRLLTGEPYMLMEHLSGVDLERWLDQRGVIEVDELSEYILEACDALAEAHAVGIVHRDLKPSNLFLDEQRGRRRIKVLDFGISKERDTGRARLTSTHSLLGSPLYMSPEQALEPKVVDARSDIWSLGVSLYELSTGVAPFDADGVPEVVARILQHDPPPPSVLSADLPPWFDAIVMRCLAKPMHARFQSIEELAAAIRARGTELNVEDPPTRILRREPELRMATRHEDAVTAESPSKRGVSRTPSGTERIELPPAATALGFGTFSPTPTRAVTKARTRSARWGLAIAAGALLLASGAFALRTSDPGARSTTPLGTLPAKATGDARDESLIEVEKGLIARPVGPPLASVRSPESTPSASSSFTDAPTRVRPPAPPIKASATNTASPTPSKRNVLDDL